MLKLVGGAIDVAAARRAVDHPGNGCVIVFEGVARDTFEGRRVVRLEYEAYAEMAEPVLAEIAADHGPELAKVLERCSFLLDEVAIRDRDTVLGGDSTLDILPPFAGG